MTNRKYATGAALRTALEERLRRIAREEAIDLQRLRRQVGFDRFLARLFSRPDSSWVLKGGYAMELRFHTARATKDLDFTVRAVPGGRTGGDAVLEHLQDVGVLDIGDFFAFRVAEASTALDGAPYGGARYPVEASWGGRAFVKFHLDVGIGDVVLDPVETVEPRDWLAFAQIPPPRVPIISREQQLAEKLHSYTLPRPAVPNSRVRDLLDMVLLIESGTLSPEKVREALSRTFERRGTHDLPGTLTAPPDDWEGPFRALAEECRLTVSLAQAFEVLRGLHAEVA
jgi:hypothetical protein